MSSARHGWTSRLSRLLGVDAAEIVEYMCSLSSAHECRAFLAELLGPDKEQQQFANDFMKAHFPIEEEVQSQPSSQEYRTQPVRKGNSSQIEPQNSLKQTAKNTNAVMGPAQVPSLLPTKQKQKKTFKPVSVKELGSRVESGRRPCECMTGRHRLLGNCLACGRVICEQEGFGPCLFCNDYVLHDPSSGATAAQTKTAQVKERAKQRQRDEEARLLHLVGGNAPSDVNPQEALEKAIAVKDKLIQFDRQHAQRTRVLDDEMDYFETNSRWLTKEEKAQREAAHDALMQAKAKAKGRMVFSLDLEKKCLVPDEEATQIDDKAFAERAIGKNAPEIPQEQPMVDLSKLLVNPHVKEAPVFVKSAAITRTPPPRPGNVETLFSQRVQDADLKHVGDPGLCLSMHQPWASLLVAGIKTVEGRSWYTQHRGRLWIAATVRPPVPEEVAAVEDQYRNIYKGHEIEFPDYPVSCLLGCVDLVDCLTQEEFQIEYGHCAQQESTSRYLLVCENARELPIKLKMTGDHKICM